MRETQILRQEGAPDKPIVLGEYVSGNNSIDPIELYAYYLGLYINNNRDNKNFYAVPFVLFCNVYGTSPEQNGGELPARTHEIIADEYCKWP